MGFDRAEMVATYGILWPVCPPRTPFDVRFAPVDVHRTDLSRRPGTAIIVSRAEDAGRTVRSAPAHCSSGIGRAVHDVGLGTATAPCVIASIASCARGDCFMISRTSATGTLRSRPAYPKAISPRVRRCPSCRTLSPRRKAASYGWRSCRHTFRATPDPGVMCAVPCEGTASSAAGPTHDRPPQQKSNRPLQPNRNRSRRTRPQMPTFRVRDRAQSCAGLLPAPAQFCANVPSLRTRRVAPAPAAERCGRRRVAASQRGPAVSAGSADRSASTAVASAATSGELGCCGD